MMLSWKRLSVSMLLLLVAGAGSLASAADAPATEPLAASAPASAPADAPAASWPPGLLMDGLDAVGIKKGFDALGLRTYGHLETGFMGRLTGGQNPLPARLFDGKRPNNLRLNQLALTVDRPYDSSKQFDIGGRVDGYYGGDSQYTKSWGLSKMGSGDAENWFDLVQMYGQLWFKTGKESGLEITVGKFVTPFGYEVIDATGNALYSHSYLFNYAIPFTHTGAMAKYILNSQWSVYFAVVNGWDDFRDNNHAHSYMAGGAWSSAEQIDNHARAQAFLNFITGPEQEDNVSNYRTVIDGTFTYWWTGKLSQTINADWGTEQGAVGDGRSTHWYGIAHYLTYVFNDYISGTWRTEWFRDGSGYRTGLANASYYENTFGLTITPLPADKVLKNLSLRPELRWDFADEAAFGGHSDQLTLGMDVIFKF